MKKIDKIIPVGSKVLSKIGNIEMMVTGICARGVEYERMQYELSYFLNGEHKTVWLDSYEIEYKEDNSKPMGFSAPMRDSTIYIESK